VQTSETSPPGRRRILPALGLLFLSPWVGEYLLGNISGRDILALPFLVPLYGAGALLIRAVALLGLAAVLVAGWSRRPGWTVRHQFALVAGALLTYAWGGFVLTSLMGPGDPVRWAGNMVFAVLAVLLLVAVAAKLKGSRDGVTTVDGRG
jgi:hypothetical protein